MQSDFSYLDRLVCSVAALLFIAWRLTSTGATRLFSWTALKRVELKLVTIILLLLSLILVIVYDCIAVTIKYREGYWVDPVTGLIMTRPLQRYDSRDMQLFPAIAVMRNLSWSMQCTALFMLMAMWNHMSKAITNRKFMSSIEFKAYAVYSILSLAAFPFLELGYYFSGNYSISTLVPVGLYAFQSFLLLIFTQVANFRFRRLLKQMSLSKSRIAYYQSMNNFLSFGYLLILISLLVSLFDAVTADALAYNKLVSDVFMKLFNLGFMIIYVVAFLVLCPDRSHASSAEQSSREQASVKQRPMLSMPATPLSARSTTNMLPATPFSSSDIESNVSSPKMKPAVNPGPMMHLKRDTNGFFTVKRDTMGTLNSEALYSVDETSLYSQAEPQEVIRWTKVSDASAMEDGQQQSRHTSRQSRPRPQKPQPITTIAAQRKASEYNSAINTGRPSMASFRTASDKMQPSSYRSGMSFQTTTIDETSSVVSFRTVVSANHKKQSNSQ